MSKRSSLPLPSPAGFSLEDKRNIAKAGMALSLGALVATSLTGVKKEAKAVHIGSGVALVGFSIWHVTLYSGNFFKKSGS
jgi:hypothetical protein